MDLRRKRAVFCLLFLASCFLPLRIHAQSAVPAYRFSLNSLDEKKIELASFEGKVVFLDFWASWCPPCRASLPAVEKLHKKYADNKDVVIIGVNMEDAATAKKFLEGKQKKYINVVGDEHTAKMYQVRGIPAFFLIDRKGNIANRWVGFSEHIFDEWVKAIEQALTEKIESSSQKKPAKGKKKK